MKNTVKSTLKPLLKVIVILPIVGLLVISNKAEVVAGNIHDEAFYVSKEEIVPVTKIEYISGKVTDADGTAMKNVWIRLKYTYNAVMTDSEGRYKIKVDAPSNELVAAFLGFKTIEKSFEDSSKELNFVMQKEVKDLEEVIVIASDTKDKNKTKEEEIKITDEEMPFRIENSPSFPGSNDALQKYFSENIKYPKIVEQLGLEGRMIVSVVVDVDSTIHDIKILGGIHPLLDEEAVRVIKGMPKWNPGKKDGKIIKSQAVFPINFELKNKVKTERSHIEEDDNINKNSEDRWIRIFNEPEFFEEKYSLNKYILNSIEYPAKAKRRKIEGEVIVRFVVAKSGQVKDVKIEKSVNPLLDKEAFRVIDQLPDWKPGMQCEETVDVEYRIPINFRLQ
ncbi:MAG: TonB family protein [Bacteroidales bacterium]|nr:TonB family protein [Bacteroidales bacterium]